jgi:hypothetical protein
MDVSTNATVQATDGVGERVSRLLVQDQRERAWTLSWQPLHERRKQSLTP